jgi:hypothetical protein
VATVTNGVITPGTVGAATITATTADGGYAASCTVGVSELRQGSSWTTATPINLSSIPGTNIITRTVDYIIATGSDSYIIKLGQNLVTAPIEIDGNISANASLLNAAITLLVDYDPQKEITISLPGSNAKPLFLIAGDGTNPVTLILDNITLKGQNTMSALVHVNLGAKLIMNGHSKITGNINLYDGTDSYSGGVDIIDGTLIMEDDAQISGNQTVGNNYRALAGGVYVETGTLTMKDNAQISSNTASNYMGSQGGGVYMKQGHLTMKDSAAITNNTLTVLDDAQGGGVSLEDNSTLKMYDNASISNNTIISPGAVGLSGGGVYVDYYSSFEMYDEVSISNNTLQSSGPAFGGGVSVHIATFTMSGGEISGNTVKSSDPESGGGGVFLDELFIKTGGVIYGHIDGSTDPKDNKVVKDTSEAYLAVDHRGHAIGNYDGIGVAPVTTPMKEYTSGEDNKLYAEYDNPWILIDPTPGGLGDTSLNWSDL